MCKYSLMISVNVPFVVLQVEKSRKYTASIKVTACDFCIQINRSSAFFSDKIKLLHIWFVNLEVMI